MAQVRMTVSSGMTTRAPRKNFKSRVMGRFSGRNIMRKRSTICAFVKLSVVTLVLLLASAQLSVAQSPLGLADDQASHPPPATGTYAYNTFIPTNTLGWTYVDPIFGTTVERVTTDHYNDDIYAKNGWWSADGTRYLHRYSSSNMEVINVVSNTIEYTGIACGDVQCADASFDPVNSNVVYTLTTTKIVAWTLTGGSSPPPSATWFTPPSGVIKTLGGSINWMDAAGAHFVVRYGNEPSVHLYDISGGNPSGSAYANPVDGSLTIDQGSYVGITPDGKYLVGWDHASPGPNAYGMGASWPIDSVGKSIGSETNFWTLCGDHASFISPSDGRDYAVTTDCDFNPGVWRVDITNNAAPYQTPANQTNEAAVLALPNNKKLISTSWAQNGGHFTTVATGVLSSWAFFVSEDPSDTFNSGSDNGSGYITPWEKYKQQIIGVNVVSGARVLVVQHRSRGLNPSYYYRYPRNSVSWGGQRIAWSSDFNQSSPQPDIYAVSLLASGASLSPSSLTFSIQVVNTTSAAQAVTLTNNGNATLNISSIAVTGDFAQTNNCGATVAVNGTCAINVTFTPTVAGTRTGTLTVTDDAPTSPQTVSLSGTGSAADVLAGTQLTAGTAISPGTVIK